MNEILLHKYTPGTKRWVGACFPCAIHFFHSQNISLSKSSRFGTTSPIPVLYGLQYGFNNIILNHVVWTTFHQIMCVLLCGFNNSLLNYMVLQGFITFLQRSICDINKMIIPWTAAPVRLRARRAALGVAARAFWVPGKRRRWRGRDGRPFQGVLEKGAFGWNDYDIIMICAYLWDAFFIYT